MRKYVILAVMALASMVMASAASADDIQSIDAKLTPTKLDKKKFKPAKIFVDIQTKNNSGATINADQPPTATRTVVNFPTNMKFDTTAVPNCKVDSNAITNTTADQARELCGKDSQVSIDSGTSATITVDTNPTVANGANFPVVVQVTAFNGQKKDTLYLHTDPEGIPTKPVLVGKLKKGPKGFGNSLDVSIPALGAGAISDFQTTVKAGKYVQARCKSKTNDYQAISTFTNFPGGNTVSDDTTTKCKRK